MSPLMLLARSDTKQFTAPRGFMPPGHLHESIVFKELFPIVVAAHLWGAQCSRLHVEFLCDNASTLAVLNSGTSRDPRVMDLMRRLTRLACKFNFSFRASHIPGSRNSCADALSRFHLQSFRQLVPYADQLPTIIPPHVFLDLAIQR